MKQYDEREHQLLQMQITAIQIKNIKYEFLRIRD